MVESVDFRNVLQVVAKINERWSMVDGWASGRFTRKFNFPKRIVGRSITDGTQINGLDCFKFPIDDGN
jgi:hypothetical protein